MQYSHKIKSFYKSHNYFTRQKKTWLTLEQQPIHNTLIKIVCASLNRHYFKIICNEGRARSRLTFFEFEMSHTHRVEIHHKKCNPVCAILTSDALVSLYPLWYKKCCGCIWVKMNHCKVSKYMKYFMFDSKFSVWKQHFWNPYLQQSTFKGQTINPDPETNKYRRFLSGPVTKSSSVITFNIIIFMVLIAHLVIAYAASFEGRGKNAGKCRMSKTRMVIRENRSERFVFS